MLKLHKSAEGIELVIDSVTGEAFATPSGYALMTGLTVRAIQQRLDRGFRGTNIQGVKTAEVLTTGGLQGTNIIPAEVVFDWLFYDSIDLAKAMGKAGATIYLHQLAGFTVSSSGSAELDATLKALWNSQRDNHRLIYHRNMTSTEAEKLHRMAFNESIADYKARRPVFAEALENDTTNERFSPDHSDVEEIQKLVLLRRSFVRAKQAHKANPYVVAVAALSA